MMKNTQYKVNEVCSMKKLSIRKLEKIEFYFIYDEMLESTLIL